MKRRGFTLTEVLVTIGILGIVTAVMAPVISNLIPDKNKAQVLKLSKVITDINTDLLNNPSIYYSDNTTCTALDCTQQPYIAPYNTDANYKGATKYPFLLASKLHIVDTPTTSSGTTKFTTVDGVDWEITAYGGTGYSVMLDMNRTDAPNCFYLKDSCEKPDRYYFAVDVNGAVSGRDQLTQAYLVNPTKLNDKKNDIRSADTYTTDLSVSK